MKDKKYDIALVILGSIAAFFISVSASAFYDMFRTIALEADHSDIQTFQLIFMVGPLAFAVYIFKYILDDLKD